MSHPSSLTGSIWHASEATLVDLPQLCDDIDCSYPIGPACDACIILLDARHRRRKFGRRDRTRAWIKEIAENAHIAAWYAHRVFLGGAADGTNSIASSELSEASDSSWEQSSSGSLAVEPRSANCTCVLGPSNPCQFSPSSVARVPGPAPTEQRVDRWLDFIFDEDLAAKGRNKHFVGGAEDRDDLSDQAYVYCERCGYRVVADMEKLHEVQCAYAYREQELLQASIERIFFENKETEKRMKNFGAREGCVRGWREILERWIETRANRDGTSGVRCNTCGMP